MFACCSARASRRRRLDAQLRGRQCRRRPPPGPPGCYRRPEALEQFCLPVRTPLLNICLARLGYDKPSTGTSTGLVSNLFSGLNLKLANTPTTDTRYPPPGGRRHPPLQRGESPRRLCPRHRQGCRRPHRPSARARRRRPSLRRTSRLGHIVATHARRDPRGVREPAVLLVVGLQVRRSRPRQADERVGPAREVLRDGKGGCERPSCILEAHRLSHPQTTNASRRICQHRSRVRHLRRRPTQPACGNTARAGRTHADVQGPPFTIPAVPTSRRAAFLRTLQASLLHKASV